MKRTKNEGVYIDVIKELVNEKNKWEMRAKHPLPAGWIYGEDHPRIAEATASLSCNGGGKKSCHITSK